MARAAACAVVVSLGLVTATQPAAGPTADAEPAPVAVGGDSGGDPAPGPASTERSADAPGRSRGATQPAPAAAEVVPAPARAVPTDEILPDHVPGRDLLDESPARVRQVAARSGLETGRLTTLLTEDDTAWVSPQGRVYFREPAPGEPHEHGTDLHAEPATAATETAEAAETPAQDTAQTTAQTTAHGQISAPAKAPALSRRYPDSQTFALQSRPGAARTIFLDVDGAEVRGTAWNAGRNRIQEGRWPGFDSDGAPGGFSASEHAWVQEVWRQVAETYAPFDVNVTTRDLGAGAWDRTSSSDTRYGARVVVTGSATARQQACGGCLGVAYINSFGQVDRTSQYQPAWVFVSATMSPTIAAQAVSHEVGHNLGLVHDGVLGSSSEYYAGTRDWGPIMGSASHRAVSQWSRGEYARASNTEDDLAVMARRLPLRPDDHGDTTTAARPLGTAAAYDVEGVISTRRDVDLFRVDVRCETTLQARATGVGQQSALDLRLDLLDAAGTQLTSAAPVNVRGALVSPSSTWSVTGTDASLSRTVRAGTYYLRVDGVGSGTGAAVGAGTGWTDYASLGQYRLTATGCVAAPAAGAAGTAKTTPAPSLSPTPSPTSTPAPSVTATPTLRSPAAPRIATAGSGRPGDRVSATVRWTPAADATTQQVRRYRITAYQLTSSGTVRRSYTAAADAGVRAVEVRLPSGRYRFAVQAANQVGVSPASARSNVVLAR